MWWNTGVWNWRGNLENTASQKYLLDFVNEGAESVEYVILSVSIFNTMNKIIPIPGVEQK